jgi:hypothetical protein
MEANQRWHRPLRPGGADCEELVRGRILLAVQHRAVVLAMTPTARGKARIRILREREQRRNQRKRECREQQDGEQTSHET